MQSRRQPIRTIGHGNRSTAEIVAALRAAGVETVIDVRRYPKGRRQPHHAMGRLMTELPALGLAYEALSTSWAVGVGRQLRL